MPVKFKISINGLTYKHRLGPLIQRIEDILNSEKGDFEIEVEKETVPIQGTANTYLSDDTDGDSETGFDFYEGETEKDGSDDGHESGYFDRETSKDLVECNDRIGSRSIIMPKPVKRTKPSFSRSTTIQDDKLSSIEEELPHISNKPRDESIGKSNGLKDEELHKIGDKTVSKFMVEAYESFMKQYK